MADVELRMEDFSPEVPTFVFVGANIGGEMTFRCGECGAMLQEPSKDTHAWWHLRTNAIARMVLEAQAQPKEPPTPVIKHTQPTLYEEWTG